LKSLKGPLQQHYFWKSFDPYFQEGDCIIAEVGTAQFATLELSLPPKAEYFTQIFYSCIGFTVGALLGALVARKERGHNGRVILFVGDGSLHMTVQVRILLVYE
jgi:pyruvate decarboxylase